MTASWKRAEAQLTTTVVPAWEACGDPRRDLPSWVRSFSPESAVLASLAILGDGVRGEELSELVREAFISTIGSLPGSPCKVWGFLPRPTDRDGDKLERYMRFNAGRTSAYRSLGERVSIVPAGTCVGHAGRELVVHALWLDSSFTAIENPRQCPAWRYSTRFGPVPPAFTRAVRTPTLLLASGTAAVIGEDSVHAESLERQFAESILNLESLAVAGGADGAWRSLQIYVRDRHDLARMEVLGAERFGDRVERVLQAPICRRELLVEIEGVCDVT